MDDLGFDFATRKNGEVVIRRNGAEIVTLRNDAAREFLEAVAGADETTHQQIMALETGNYKHGNERTAAEHPRNLDR